jgi:hypothetical protein
MMLHFLKESAKETYFTGLANGNATRKKDEDKTSTQVRE